MRSNARVDAFDQITPDAAYWLGFIFTDGYVSRADYRVQVALSACDQGHLVKLRDFLGSANKIRSIGGGKYGVYDTRPACILSVKSVLLAKTVLDHGRYEGPITPALVSSPDFWRGAMDGDGTIGIDGRGSPYFGLVGSERLLTAFLGFLTDSGIAGQMSVRPSKSICIVGIRGKTAERVIETLYSNAVVALDRKSAAALSIVESVRSRRERALAGEADLRSRYEPGATLVELGQHYSVSDVTVLRWMRQADIPRRPAKPRQSPQEGTQPA